MKKVKLLMSLSSATVVLTAVSIGTTSCSNLSLEQSKSEKANSYAYHDSLSFDFEIEEEIMHTVKINTASGGTVSIKKDNRVIGDTRGKEFNKKFAIGTVLQIITTPAIGYKFANWSDESLVKTDKNGYTITVGENDISLIANFTPADQPKAETVKKFTLSIPQTKNVHLYRVNNEIKLSPYSFSFKDGEKVKIEARTNDEYAFKQWSDGSTENPRIITMSENRTLFAVTNKNTEYKEIKWDELNRHTQKAHFFATTSKSVDPNSSFDVDDNDDIYYYLSADNDKYTDPLTGDSYDVMAIQNYDTLLDFGSMDQNPNTAALNFTTCQKLIDDIYGKPESIQIEYRDKKIYGNEKLGFVWAQNNNKKWQPYVVKEILDEAFYCPGWSRLYFGLHVNPIHCSVIIPWTVDYIGELAFDDASTDTGKKLHVVYTNRVGIDKKGNTFWEGIKQDKMDWSRDKDWDIKTTIIYNAFENKWEFPMIINKHGEKEMAAIIKC